MIAFILQALLWLLIAFILGWLLGRLLKGLFCSQDVPTESAAPVAATVSQLVIPEIDAGISGISADNLRIIEGIGPKMEAMLHENGVGTWSALAAHSTSELQAILDKYGKKYQIIKPAPWVKQAQLASEGKVEELIEYQKLDGVSKLEKMLGATRKSGFGLYKKNDLKIVEGIGPKIESLLQAAGINTWKQLSATDMAAIQSILDKAGSSFSLADPESWALQAELADNNQWKELKEYQDVLNGGRSH